MTSLGPLDVLGEIGAQRSYPSLLSHSRLVDLGDGIKVRVLDLDVLIETKKEVHRPKDLATLPILEQTLEKSRRRKD